jgi:hypothetical protein
LAAVSSRVVAVIDWRSASLLKDNARFLEKAGIAGKGRLRNGRSKSLKHRSLTLREDGSCELQRFSTAAVARRLGGVVVGRTARKAKDEQRG